MIPTEVIEIFSRNSISIGALEDFDEAWGIFTNAPAILGDNKLRTRLRNLSLVEFVQIANTLGISSPPADSHTFDIRGKIDIPKVEDRYAFAIWASLARQGKI